MLDWSTGPMRVADAFATPLNEGVSCIDEPPETPAHIFALRAFKTAIFGTPHPEQQIVRTKRKATPGQSTRKGPPKSAGPKKEQIKAEETARTKGSSNGIPADLVVSPTKGILLTPGVGTSRRKNVSFMHFHEEANVQEIETLEVDEPMSSQDNSPTRRRHQRDMRPRPSNLTKTLVELSKKRSDEPMDVKTNPPQQEGATASPTSLKTALDHAVQTESDHTIDLSQPRSQSGQHWKTEYERYFHRSDRELKSVLQHGQNVKSFAVQKDSEASMLAERLQQEGTKVRALERRISRMEEQLRVAQAQDPRGQGDHARLVAELAQQTALAVKYKQKLEQQQHDTEWLAPKAQGTLSAGEENLADELENLRQVAQEAEQRAEKTEAENTALKRSLARVKEEMMSYESRRKTREERLKHNEEKFKAAKDLAEAQLSQIRQEHKNLLEGKQEQPMPSNPEGSRPLQQSSGNLSPQRGKTSDVQQQNMKENRPQSTSRSPRKKRQQKPAIDIWTMSSPREEENNSNQTKGHDQSDIPPSSVKHDIHRALKEIDLNLIPNENIKTASSPFTENPLPEDLNTKGKKEPIGYEDGMPVWASTSLTRQEPPASSPAKLLLQPSNADFSDLRRTSYPTTGRSASMVSRPRGTGNRTGSMGSVRRDRSPMTVEKQAEARARLAERRRQKGEA